MWKLAAIVTAGLGFGLGLAASRVEAAPPDDIKSWLSKQVEEASGNFGGRAFKVVYRVESQEKLDAGELARLREKLKNLPEHPERARLRHLEQLEKFGPEVRKQTVWFRDGEMRVNREAGADPASKYFDFVSLKDSGWKMTPDQMFVLGAAEKRPPGHTLVSAASSITFEVSDFICLWARSVKVDDKSTVTMEPEGRWVASFERETPVGPRLFVLHGSWNNESSSGQVTRSEVVDPRTKQVLARSSASEFRASDVFSREVAHVITNEEGGRETSRLVLESMSPLRAEEFEGVTRTPAFDGSDVVRGKVTFTQVTDFRDGSPSYEIKTPEGTVQSLSVEDTSVGHGRSVLRTTGWVVAGSLVVFLVLLRVRRGSSS